MRDFAREPAGDTLSDDPKHLRPLHRMAPDEVIEAMTKLELSRVASVEPILPEQAANKLLLPPSVLPPPVYLHHGPHTITGREYLTS